MCGGCGTFEFIKSQCVLSQYLYLSAKFWFSKIKKKTIQSCMLMHIHILIKI